MTRIFTLAGLSALVLCLGAGAAEARNECRDYTKSRYHYGVYQQGRAQACHMGGGYWQITSISGPQSLYDPLIEIVQRDVFNLGGVRLTLTSTNYAPRYYYPPPAYVVYPPVQYNHGHYDKHDNRKHGHKNGYNNGHSGRDDNWKSNQQRWAYNDHYRHIKNKLDR